MIEPIAGALIAHFVGDYIIQSDYLANTKTERWLPAWLHGITYTLPFLFVTQSPLALIVICVTHVLIDHYRLAKHVMWATNNAMCPRDWRYRWREQVNGMPPDRPIWLSFWLMIIVDNTLHVVINSAAVLWL